MRRFTTRLTATILLTASSAALAQGSWQRTPDGITLTPTSGSEKVLRVQVYGDGLFRVTSGPEAQLAPSASYMINARPASGGFEVSEAPGSVTLTTPKASAIVDIATGNVSFRNAAGETVLAESGAPV